MTPPGATTPQLIKQGMYASVACALLVLIAVTSGTRTHRDALQIIGRDTAPRIIAAEHVSAAMADMDASAVHELLTPAAPTFDSRRKEASEVLIAAAESMHDGDAERVPMRALATGLTSYTAQIQRAFDLRRAGSPAYIDAYRAAAQIMDETLVPAAELDRTERARFDQSYAEQQKWSSAAMLFLVLASLALIGVLLALQVFLTRRTRRIINPYLMIATGLAFFGFFFFAESFTKADQELQVAKQDAFESIHTLWKTRSAAYVANAQHNRYLLNPSAFQQKAQNSPAETDQAIGEKLQAGQSVFDQAVKDGFDALDHEEIMASIVCGVIALLALLGLLPRLREYSAA